MVILADVEPGDRSFLQRVTAFVDDEVLPVARVRDIQRDYPGDLVARMRNLGVFGASLRPLPVYALAMEEIARGWVSLAPIANAHSSVLWILRRYGTVEQRDQWEDDMSHGRVLAAYALTEPHAGSDLQAIVSTASREPEGWRIQAHKTFITHARNADVLLVLVRTDPSATPAHRGLSCFLLRAGEWTVVRDLGKCGSRAVETCELVVDDVLVPPDRCIGPAPDNGFAQVMGSLELGRLAVAAAAVGVGRAALWAARDYAAHRKAFGQPILEFQGARFELADAATKLAAAHALNLMCAEVQQQGGRCDFETSMAKIFSSETAVEAALHAVRSVGGAGYVDDYDVERLFRDAALYLVGEGANGVLKELIATRLRTAEPSLQWV